MIYYHKKAMIPSLFIIALTCFFSLSEFWGPIQNLAIGFYLFVAIGVFLFYIINIFLLVIHKSRFYDIIFFTKLESTIKEKIKYRSKK